MTTIRVLTAVRLPEGARATVTLDGRVTVEGVTLRESLYSGRTTAAPPLHRDGRPMIAWSDAVASQVAAAILAALPSETGAVSEALPFAEPEPPCPACGGDWLKCGCTLEDADAAYTGEAA